MQAVTRVRVPIGFTPRAWARQAYGLYLRHPWKDFSVNACPGAGKTKFAVMLAYNELHRGQIERVDIVAPSRHICDQWMRDMASWGINLDGENTRESRDCVGRVITYQKLGMDAESFVLKDGRRTLVILDEIHHAGDSLNWGESLRRVFGNAHRRILLSGTPFRSDNNSIPFVRYAQGETGLSISDYSYGYGEALRDRYCAPLFFPHHDGEFTWERDGKSNTATFDTRLKGAQATDRLRTALDPEGEYVQGMLAEAHQQLLEVRKTHARAAGIIFGKDIYNVQLLAQSITKLTGRKPPIITNDDPEASAHIRQFKNSKEPWIVSVKMISEGVDIPRLRVGVFLSNTRTELFFRQAAGRLVRLDEGLEEQPGYLYIPSDPRLVAYAADMQRERKHYLKEEKNEDELLLEMAQRERSEPDELASEYRFLQSVGERRGVIETIAEESGQQLFDFAVEMLPEVTRTVEPAPAPESHNEPITLADQKLSVRKKGGRISSLVQDLHLRYGIPHRQIHAQLNKRQGVRSQQQCTLNQLNERESLLDRWFRSGAL
jgi:superfamily II DNA or RNA helicase